MMPSVPQYSDKNKHYLIAGAYPVSYLDDGTQEEQAAPLAASPDWAQLSSDTPTAGVNVYPGAGGLGTSKQYGQSVVGLGQVLTQIQIPVKKTGAPASSCSVLVYSATGTAGNYNPTGSILAVSGANGLGTITTSYTLQSFSFTGGNQITLALGTTYIVVFNYQYGDAANYLTVGTMTSLSGNASYSNDGTTWTVDNTQEMIQYINGTLGSIILDGNVVHMVASPEGTYSAYIITDTTHVYGIKTDGTIFDCLYPSTVSVANTLSGRLSVGGSDATNKSGYLFATYGSTNVLYSMPLPSGTWAIANTQLISGVFHAMEPFLNYVMIGDTSFSFTAPNLIRKIDPSSPTSPSVLLTGINIGQGFGILKMVNFNDKYLAVAAGKQKYSTSSAGFAQNYIFLWNGTSTSYNFSVKIPGQFIDMAVIDSQLYIAVKTASGKTTLYKLFSTYLRKVITTQFSKINSAPIRSYNLCSLFNFRNYVGMNMESNNDLTNPVLVYGQDEIGTLEFVHSSGRLFDQFVVGYDGNLFTNVFVSGYNSVLFYIPTTNTKYQNILYKSQWIPVQNLSGIDIYYDTPPQSTSDTINITIYGRGENIISGTSTQTLTAITSTNYLNTTRSRVDVAGFTGNLLMIKLSTTSLTWRPIIRAIVCITE